MYGLEVKTMCGPWKVYRHQQYDLSTGVMSGTSFERSDLIGPTRETKALVLPVRLGSCTKHVHIKADVLISCDLIHRCKAALPYEL